MLCKCHWIVLYTVHFTAFCLGGPFFPGHGVGLYTILKIAHRGALGSTIFYYTICSRTCLHALVAFKELTTDPPQSKVMTKQQMYCF